MREQLTGRHVSLSLLAIVFATVVVPPAAAWFVNQNRINHAAGDISALVSHLRDTGVADTLGSPSVVLCGPGRVPDVSTMTLEAWGAMTRRSLSGVSDNRLADPWGNCYLIGVASSGGRARYLGVFSAGPNGIVETSRSAEAGGLVFAGDDIGAVVR
jgi:hypothetical protein